MTSSPRKKAFVASSQNTRANGITVSTPRKRGRKSEDIVPKSEPEDLEDVGPSPAKLLRTLSGLGYDPSDATPSARITRSKRVKLEENATVVEKIEHHETLPTVPPIAASAKGKQKSTLISSKPPKPIQMELDAPHPEPLHWREAYDLIVEMRKNAPAPVDTMGCAMIMIDELDPKARRFGTLVSLMLSSQTKDEVTAAAIAKLKQSLGVLSVDTIIEAPESVLQDAICKVGFWRRKTGYLKQAAQKLKDKFDSDVPKTIDELCSLPGVGPKMAFLTLQTAWDLNMGIGVDVHVHRITNRLGWHKPPTSTPEQTRLNLQSWLPKSLHKDINPLLVGFGQVICLAVSPKCDSCTLNEKGLCPSAKPKKPKTGLAKVELVSSMEQSIKSKLSTGELVKLEDGNTAAAEGSNEGGPVIKIKIEDVPSS